MKISRPTNVTITSITAVSGSSTQPSLRMPGSPAANRSHSKLKTSRAPSPHAMDCRSAQTASANAITIEPIASDAENLRQRCGASALNPAASIGSTGINQRFLTIQGILVFKAKAQRRKGARIDFPSASLRLCAFALNSSSLQRVHFIYICRLEMPVKRDDERQAHRRFRRRDADGENHEQNSGERLRVFAEAPERDEVQVRRVEHEFDADEHDDGIAPRQRAGQADGEEHGREEEVCGERSHAFLRFESGKVGKWEG